MEVRRFFSVPHVERHGAELALLVALAALLELAAGVGLAYVAGFSQVRAVVGDVHWGWLGVLAGALVVSFAGYFLAYQGIFRVEGGPRLPRRQMYAVVAAGFGGLLAHGWGALDKKALKVAGADEYNAKARATGLAGLELAVLALGGCGAAIAVLVSGLGAPLAAAVAGVFAYRILVLWLPLPVALASLPTLRTMGERRIAQAERKAA
jgi:uncharacterized membrane protein YbhN (UPF0104 family)